MPGRPGTRPSTRPKTSCHRPAPAGFVVLHDAGSWVDLVGPGLTKDVDEATLTTNALWKAVTGKAGEQTWYDLAPPLRPDPGSPEAVEAAAVAKAASDEHWQRRRAEIEAARERQKAAASQPSTEAKLRYLESLLYRVGEDRFPATRGGGVDALLDHNVVDRLVLEAADQRHQVVLGTTQPSKPGHGDLVALAQLPQHPLEVRSRGVLARHLVDEDPLPLNPGRQQRVDL